LEGIYNLEFWVCLDLFGYAPRRGMGTWILRITRIKTDFGSLAATFFDFLRIYGA
jgi:hypothetical protein